MPETFDPTLKARLTLDDAGAVRGITQVDELWQSDAKSPRGAALAYLAEVAGTLDVPIDQLAHAHQPVSHLDPQDRGTEYRLSEEKQHFDSTTVALDQTHLNVPVWGSGLTVTTKHNPMRVVSAVNTSRPDVDASLPSEEVIERWRALFGIAARERQVPGLGEAPEAGAPATAPFVGDILAGRPLRRATRARATAEQRERRARLIRGRFFVYRYDPDERLPRPEKTPTPRPVGLDAPGLASDGIQGPESVPTLPLPDVDSQITAGTDYLVAELTFTYAIPEHGEITWLALVELETGSILYLRALAADVNGLVFLYTPITKSGSAANGSDQPNAVLNPFRDDVTLPNLNGPVAGIQSLQGSRATLSEIEGPVVAAPTETTGTEFDYQVRTNNFAAVNAYYHTDRFFSLVEDLGFSLASYFNQTTFPVPVDHRGLGNVVNAHCVGNGMGGIGHLCYALSHTGDLVNPMGIAADWRVHLHELGGHGILYEHVNSANFGFSHSAGDSFSVILNDPESNAPDRFQFLPFEPSIARRHDRDVAAGWAWGGTMDVGGYSSEQILATTMFRIYRSIGGDSSSVDRRWFAARTVAYLMLRAIATLTPATNPATAAPFANALLAVDPLNWTSEGIYGGAYGKVIRWSFEKQGLYQAPAAPTPVVTAGQPPAVDVYIDDGRSGEYSFQPIHWNTTTIWNRRKPDGKPNHQPPKLGQPNYAYVKVKNRGTQTANNVVVRGYHCKPSAGLLWPNDLQPMTTPQVAAGSLAANSTEEKVVGPFEWEPTINAWGHDCMLMIASATSDPSNIDNFTVGEVIPEWRLVPNDNNIGQRNVNPVPGGGGPGGLMDGLNGFSFWVGNPNPGKAIVDVDVKLPDLLADRGWVLSFRDVRDDRFALAYGKQRELVIELTPGAGFDREDVESADDRDIVLTVRAGGGVIGGMTYRVDPAIARPLDRPGMRPGARDAERCKEHARNLLDCLDLHGQPIARVRVKKVTVDIEMEGECC
jgi:hypothetical protein